MGMQTIGGRTGFFHGNVKTVINRTNRTLIVRVNNQEWPLEPGENFVPDFVVPYAVKQHPRAGTMQMTGEFESLVAVPGVTPEDHMGMIDPTQDGRTLTDLIDRDAQPLKGQQEVVKLTRTSAIEGSNGPAQVSRIMENVSVGSFD